MLLFNAVELQDPFSDLTGPDAGQIIISALDHAQAAGVYSMVESAVLLKAIRILINKDTAKKQDDTGDRRKCDAQCSVERDDIQS